MDLLFELEAAIGRDAEGRDDDSLIVMLGDYVDRGPRTAEVIDHLLTPPPKPPAAPAVREPCAPGAS